MMPKLKDCYCNGECIGCPLEFVCTEDPIDARGKYTVKEIFDKTKIDYDFKRFLEIILETETEDFDAFRESFAKLQNRNIP